MRHGQRGPCPTGRGTRADSEDGGKVLADEGEEGGVADDRVFDAFGEAAADFTRGKGGEGGDIGEDEAGLVEGADEVFAGGVIDADLAADGGIDGGEEGGGALDEGGAAEKGGGDEAGKVADDAAAEGDDGGGAFDPPLLLVRRRSRAAEAVARVLEASPAGKMNSMTR